MAIITSPENQKKLAHYQEIARKLARAEGLTDDQAHALAHEGKAVVWIDGGLHASEVLGAQQLMELVYEMVSRNDPETLRFLNDVIILAVHANPDGMELVSNWYMREPDPKKRIDAGRAAAVAEVRRARQQSRLLHVEHERDDQHKSRAVLRMVPADHVQPPPDRSGGGGDVRAAVSRSVQLQFRSADSAADRDGGRGDAQPVGGGRQAGRCRCAAVSTYSTWYNGGLRTTTYFHNMIGLLTETIGSPTPVEIPLVPERQLPIGDGRFRSRRRLGISGSRSSIR